MRFTVNTKCSLVVNFDSFPSNHQISQWNLKTSHAQNDRQLYSPFRGKMDKACVGNFLLCLLKAYLSTTRWSVSNKATVCLKFSLRWVFLKLLLNESHIFFSFKEILVFGQEIKGAAVLVQIRFFQNACGKKINFLFAHLNKMAVRPSRSFLQFEDREFSRWFHISWEGTLTVRWKRIFSFAVVDAILDGTFRSLVMLSYF